GGGRGGERAREPRARRRLAPRARAGSPGGARGRPPATGRRARAVRRRSGSPPLALPPRPAEPYGPRATAGPERGAARGLRRDGAVADTRGRPPEHAPASVRPSHPAAAGSAVRDPGDAAVAREPRVRAAP